MQRLCQLRRLVGGVRGRQRHAQPPVPADTGGGRIAGTQRLPGAQAVHHGQGGFIADSHQRLHQRAQAQRRDESAQVRDVRRPLPGDAGFGRSALASSGAFSRARRSAMLSSTASITRSTRWATQPASVTPRAAGPRADSDSCACRSVRRWPGCGLPVRRAWAVWSDGVGGPGWARRGAVRSGGCGRPQTPAGAGAWPPGLHAPGRRPR